MTDAELLELLPCPICNGDAHIFWDVDTDEPEAIAWHRAECRIKRCVSTSNFTTPEQAAEVWNTRNEADALRAEVEGLLDIVRNLVDDDQCEYDHNGWCQAHHLANVNDQKYTCYNAKALAAIKPNAGEEGTE